MRGGLVVMSKHLFSNRLDRETIEYYNKYFFF